MSEIARGHDIHHADTAPGDQSANKHSIAHGVWAYGTGFALACLFTVVSFIVARTHLVWMPSIPVALFVLAIGQIGIHLIFFIHITTGPDSINNIMALAFGVLVVLLLVGGSAWIMGHMTQNMMPMSEIMEMQR